MLSLNNIRNILLIGLAMLVALLLLKYFRPHTKRPSVVLVDPKNSSQNVSENASISTSILKLPNGGINNSTITSNTVYLTEAGTGALVASNVNGTGGGDAITLVPSSLLKLNTTYNFNITDGVKDLSGVSIIPIRKYIYNSISLNK
jgi:hypothetical protein